MNSIKIKNESNQNIEFPLLGSPEKFIKLKPKEFVYSNNNDLNKPIIIYRRKNILSVNEETLPDGLEFFKIYDDQSFEKNEPILPPVTELVIKSMETSFNYPDLNIDDLNKLKPLQEFNEVPSEEVNLEGADFKKLLADKIKEAEQQVAKYSETEFESSENDSEQENLLIPKPEVEPEKKKKNKKGAGRPKKRGPKKKKKPVGRPKKS